MKALLILFLTGVAVLFAGLGKNRQWLQPLSFFGALAALVVTCLEINAGGSDWNSAYASMFEFDRYALSFTAVTLVAVLLLFGLTGWGFRQLNQTLGDNLGLLLFSLTGALIMFSFTNMTMLFLGIEILSIPLYVLAGSRRDDLASNEAALKYFLMGAFATAIFLLGTTLLYGATGSFDLKTIAAAVADGRHSAGMMNAAILLIIIGLGFKISAVPFHFWAPDVYTGSPNLITAFMSTVVKTAGIGAFYRLFSIAFPAASDFWTVGLAMMAGMTMTLPNLTAIFQQNFKRMMAYSSISHAGYLLLGILVAGQAGAAGGLLVYLLTYAIATICAFAVFIVVSEQNGDAGFEVFNGLSKKQPFLAAVMAISMLSLAGIPPMAGFFGKYFLFTAAFGKYPWLVVLAILNSAVSIYYYFRVIVAMYFTQTETEPDVVVPIGFRWVMAAGLALIALITLLPGSIFGLI